MLHTAVIVEPRKHKALAFVLHNFFTHLSDDWSFIIFHGTGNIEYIKDILASLPEYAGRVTLINLNVPNLTREEYSRLLTTREFHNKIPTEMFLIFQTDTMIFHQNKHLINNFLHYDYVGAPWPYVVGNGGRIGNGGLSLRNKSKMLQIIHTVPYCGEPEDVYFCQNPELLYLPTVEEATAFSTEHLFNPSSVGCHQPWFQRDLLLQHFPEVAELLQLNDRA